MIALKRATPAPREPDERDEIALALLEGIPAAERTLLLELLARSFVDAYAAAERSGSVLQLIDWADRMCDAHADAPAVRDFFATAVPAMASYMRRCGAGSEERGTLAALERSLRAVAAKPRRELTCAGQHLDEIDAALNVLIVRLERSDPLTAEHSRAVSAWCARLARRLSLSEAETTFAARCGMVHDVGKVTTPAEILSAPRKLTEREWNVMRSHTTVGERMVLDDPRLAIFAPAVRSHHERLDGNGYPDRLSAAGIDLATRIVTVADSFNAMIGRRPYRLPMSPAAALEQLATHAGTQFDPTVVAAMRDIVR
jgi:HD-GYP domain-containing protein (c-di-GMP phosphodiesterase class II)